MASSSDHEIGYVRHKHNENDTFDQLKAKLSKAIDDKSAAISSVSVKRKVAIGLWLSEETLVKITQNRNIPNYMGFTRDSVRYLRPIESLFLMESESLQVIYHEIALSVEEAFSLLLTTSRQLDVYRVYAHLSRVGYSVKLHENECNVESNALSIKEDRKRKQSIDTVSDDCDAKLSKHINSNNNASDFDRKIYMTNIRPLNKRMLTKNQFNDDCGNTSDDNTNLSIVYDFNDTECGVQLSNPLLNGSVKPLLGCCGSVLSSDELYGLLQSYGPNCVSQSLDSTSDLEFNLDVYKSGKKLSECPMFHVIVTNSRQAVPRFDTIFYLKTKAKAENICFAVVDEDINFYSITPFDLNDEFPKLWQKHL